MGERWVSADSRRLVSASEQDQVQRFTAVVHELESLSLRLAAVLHVMRECQAGQPQAARSHREGDDDGRSPLGQLWCWEHEQSLAVCIDRDGLLCTGELGRDISDPVGNAAILVDRATRDREMLLRRLEELTSKGMQVLGLAANYPTSSAELDNPDPDDEVGTTWCRSCWKDNKTCTPITTRLSTGQRYYRDRCRWCGDMTKTIGGEPPTWLVAKHLRGERITTGHVDQAKKAVALTKKTKKAKKRR
jgi:hypothetical protein